MTTAATPASATPAPTATTASAPPPHRPSGGEHSRELHSFPSIREELALESASLQRELLLWHRWIRYAAGGLAAVGGAVMVARGDDARLWLPLFAAAATYLLFNAGVAWTLRRGAETVIPRGLPALVLGMDLAAVAAMVFLSAVP